VLESVGFAHDRCGFQEGLAQLSARRPLTPHGTNLLGLVKHLTGCEIGYFGDAFDRPFPRPPPWLTRGGAPTVNFWATAQETRHDIVGFYHPDYWLQLHRRIERAARDAAAAGPIPRRRRVSRPSSPRIRPTDTWPLEPRWPAAAAAGRAADCR
jgi:hypothetical protein